MRYSLLMLTHNRLDAVRRCIASLAPTLLRNDVDVWILDNASTDGTAEFVRELTKQHVLSDENLGVAGGRQRLLEKAIGDYIVFLDSDTAIIDDGWLDALGEFLDKHENVGLVGPGGSMVKADWSNFTAATANAECDTIAGFCQCFRRELLDYGLKIDTATFGKFWTEDSDFALRIRDLGWDIWCLPVGVVHSPAHSGYGQDETLHEAHLAAFRERWQGKGLVKCEGAY